MPRLLLIEAGCDLTLPEGHSPGPTRRQVQITVGLTHQIVTSSTAIITQLQHPRPHHTSATPGRSSFQYNYDNEISLLNRQI